MFPSLHPTKMTQLLNLFEAAKTSFVTLGKVNTFFFSFFFFTIGHLKKKSKQNK